MSSHTSEEIREALKLSIGPMAAEYAKGAGLDWADDLDEDARKHARDVARKAANHLALRLGVDAI